MFSPCTQDGGAPSRSDQLQRGAASDSHHVALCDYPLQQCPSVAPEKDGRHQAKAKHSKPVKINLKMVTFKKPKSAERGQVQRLGGQAGKQPLVHMKDASTENDYQMGGGKQATICSLALPHGFQQYGADGQEGEEESR